MGVARDGIFKPMSGQDVGLKSYTVGRRRLVSTCVEKEGSRMVAILVTYSCPGEGRDWAFRPTAVNFSSTSQSTCKNSTIMLHEIHLKCHCLARTRRSQHVDGVAPAETLTVTHQEHRVGTLEHLRVVRDDHHGSVLSVG